jgi:hypothetical protein
MGIMIVPYQGREIKYAGNKVFQDWTVTVINDEAQSIRNTFENWSQRMNSHRSNVRQNNDYFSDIEVIHFDPRDRVTKKVKLIGAFPNDISAVELDWATNDTPEEFTVTFSYQWTE